jgi:hypothetical protein
MENTVTSLDRIAVKISEYQQALRLIEEKRNSWNHETKELVFRTLLNVQKSAPLNWSVRKSEGVENLEEVCLRFNNSASGITDYTRKEPATRTKYGGALVFDQEYNGDISVEIVYPFVENCVDGISNRKVDRVPPTRITEDYITMQVIRFLDEMIKWENSSSKNVIGFKWDGD